MYIDSEFYFDDAPLDGILYDPATTLALEQAAGIDMVVWMAQPRLRPINRAMAQALEGFAHRDRFILCCTLNPQFDQETVVELEHCVLERGFKGLKLMATLHGYNLNTPPVYTLLNKARELGVVVNIHSGSYNSHPLQIAALARRYPELPFIMDHMGYRMYTGDAVIAAKECPNIYLSTTLISPAEPIVIKFVVAEVGPERVVFGSNGPGTYVDMSMEGIRRLKLGKEAEDLIFGGNAARAYNVA
ncbi:MAG: amidohydrolase [Chloroflexi bacterium]|nr:amidohydrolase [Chloroflexota bacterium]